jgi:hypothetical protein
MTPETRRGSIRLLQHLATLDDRGLYALASAVAGRRIEDVADMTPDEIGRLSVQLNRRAMCAPAVLARADAGDPPDYAPEED